YSADPDYRELKVPVTLVKRPRQRVVAAPAVVAWSVPAHQPVPARLLRLRDTAGKGVEVERVEADDPAVQCTWAQGPDNLATVRLTVDGQRVPAAGIRSAVHIRLHKPVAETVTVPVTFTREKPEVRSQK